MTTDDKQKAALFKKVAIVGADDRVILSGNHVCARSTGIFAKESWVGQTPARGTRAKPGPDAPR